jgi:hypothetical protein
MVKKLCLMCVLVDRMHCACSADKQWTTSLCEMQEAACNHVTTIGYGAFHGTNDERLITVTTRMHIEVDRYPTW